MLKMGGEGEGGKLSQTPYTYAIVELYVKVKENIFMSLSEVVMCVY